MTTFAKGQNPRSSWLEAEDAKLTELVGAMGERNWALIAQELPGRVGKQCRERWRNHLNPSIRHDPFTEEEDDTIIRLVKEIGTRWARISELMEGRTENSIKNRYYCFLKRKVEIRPRKKTAASSEQTSPQSSTVISSTSSDSDDLSDSAVSVGTLKASTSSFALPAAQLTKSPKKKRSLLGPRKTAPPTRQLRTWRFGRSSSLLDPTQPQVGSLAISDLVCGEQDDDDGLPSVWSAAIALLALRSAA